MGLSFRLAAAAVAAGAALLSATAASACGYGYGTYGYGAYGYNYGYGSAYYSPCGTRYVSEPSYPVDQGPVYSAPAATAVEVSVEHDPRSYPYVHRGYSYGYRYGHGYGQGYGYGQRHGYGQRYGYGQGYGYRHRSRLSYAPEVYRRSVHHQRHRAVADRSYRTGVSRRDELAPRRGVAAPVVVRERRREGPRPELEGGPVRQP